MQVTGTRQREAWLAREFPPVEEVTGGVWSIPVPIPDNPLRYVLTYLIEHQSGFLMVDPGWNHPDSWTALTTGLAAAQIPMSAITAVVITHVHPDHHGLSGAVREQSGAWIAMHEREDAWLAGLAEPSAIRAGMVSYMRLSGAPPEHLAELSARQPAGGPGRGMARADRTLVHGDLIDVPGLSRAGHLDARPLARAPVLPPRIARAAADRRPRAAADHAQHLRLRPDLQPAG